MTSLEIIFLILLAALVFMIYREMFFVRHGNTGVIVKNLHMGMYIVKINGRKVKASSVVWDIPIGTTVTLKMYYGSFHITGIFQHKIEDAEIIEEIN